MSEPKLFKLISLFKLRSDAEDQLKRNFETVFSPTLIATRDFILNNVAGKHAILCLPLTSIDKEVLDAAGPQLTTIATISAGYDYIDVEECKKRKIAVGYAGSIVSDRMAEYTIGLMLATARRFKESIKLVEKGEWDKQWSPANYILGMEIKGSTVGMIGFGRIGQKIARLLQTFHVKQIQYCGPNEKPEGNTLNAKYVNLQELLKTLDFVIVCCSSNEQTRGMFNANLFNLMKPTSIFINIARGNLVNHDDLYEALVNKRIWAAGLDTVTPEPFPHEHPLARHENCLLLPHIGTASEPLRSEMIQTVIDNLIAGVNGKPMPVQLI